MKLFNLSIVILTAVIALASSPQFANRQMLDFERQAKEFVDRKLYNAPQRGRHADPNAQDNLRYALNAPDAPPPAQIIKKRPPLADVRPARAPNTKGDQHAPQTMLLRQDG